MTKIFQKRIKLKDGNFLDIFFNKDRNLLVVDKIRKDFKGGNEFVRVNVDAINVSFPKKKLKKVI